MALQRNEQGPQRFRAVPLFDSLHLENSFEDKGIAGRQVLDLLALEGDVFQRCLSAQPDPTALQRSNRGKCVHLLRDLDAAADLLPHRPIFALQLLDLTHRRWERCLLACGQRLVLALNYTPPGTQIRLHSSFWTLGSRPALSLTFSRLLPLLWAGANLATCHLCTRLWLCTKLWSKNTALFSKPRVGDLHASRLGASLRDPLFLEC